MYCLNNADLHQEIWADVSDNPTGPQLAVYTEHWDP